MPPPRNQEETRIDFRVYLAVIFFRWQIIALCFLYAVLGGVVYLQLATPKYHSGIDIVVYSDPFLKLNRVDDKWTSFGTHQMLLSQGGLQSRVRRELRDEWLPKLGSEKAMDAHVWFGRRADLTPTLTVNVTTRDPDYGIAFVDLLAKTHQAEWETLQKRSRQEAFAELREELDELAENVRIAEEDVIEYERQNDILRIQARGSIERGFLSALMGMKHSYLTQMMVMEAQFPQLKDANAVVIASSDILTKQVGAINPDASLLEQMKSAEDTKSEELAVDEALLGLQTKQVRLIRLERQEAEMAAKMTADNPKLQAVRAQIKQINEELQLTADIQFRRVRDRYKTMQIMLDAIESAEYRWQSKNLMASQRTAEHRRKKAVVGRYEGNYNTLNNRLHDLKVNQALNAEVFKIRTPWARRKASWPDPKKILPMCLIGGLGAGLGLAFLMQVVDNKIQTIKDVEEGIGVTFLGGIPYWAHSGLEAAIRPIVTEENSTGAMEAYRALRTTVLAELAKANEKVLFVTSADSREGKTLTTLNMAIMVAQMGQRTLLIDMDLRRGRLHRSLDVEREPGVGDALREGKSLREIVKQTHIENLWFAASGTSLDDSSEVLQSSNILDMLVEIQDDYDYVFIDTSPVLRVTDTVILTTQGIGQVLYVARVNHTPKPLIRYSLDVLKEAPILGLVMNSIEMHKISSLYYAYQYPNYAYYSNAYAYGYDYYYYDDQTHGRRKRKRRDSMRTRMGHAREWLSKTFLPME